MINKGEYEDEVEIMDKSEATNAMMQRGGAFPSTESIHFVYLDTLECIIMPLLFTKPYFILCLEPVYVI